MTATLNKARINLLADIIEEADTSYNDMFTMDNWLNISDVDQWRKPFDPETEDGELSEFVDAAATCGTAGCIAGWAVVSFGSEGDAWAASRFAYGNGASGVISHLAMAKAQELLGLNDLQAYNLFTPSEGDDTATEIPEGYDVSAYDAATALRHLAETGEVDWNLPRCKCCGGHAEVDWKCEDGWCACAETPDEAYYCGNGKNCDCRPEHSVPQEQMALL